MAFTFPVVLVVARLAGGLGMGASAVVSRAIGAGESDRVRRLTVDGLILAVVVVAVVAAGGLVTIDPVFETLGADESVMPLLKPHKDVS